MPVYNALPYLGQAVQSVFAQTISDWELIVVDDASTDGSREYLERIADPRVRLFCNTRNMRHSYTCNYGTSMARGTYVAKMDADDMMLPSRIAEQLAMLEGNPDLDVVGCGVFRMRNDGSIVVVRRPPSGHGSIARFFTGPMSLVHGPNFQITDGAIVGRTQWFCQWRYDTGIPYAQDFDLMCRSRHSSRFGNVSEPLYIYRVGSGETSSWVNQTKAVYYKAKSIVRHALRRGMIAEAALGLTALVTRPVAYAGVKMLVHAARGNNSLLTARVAPEDEKALRDGLAQIAGVKVPLRIAAL
jgi:glycosyltransferase involved in cell wall biosynthesis